MTVDAYGTIRPSDTRRSVSDLNIEHAARVGILKHSAGVSDIQMQQIQVKALQDLVFSGKRS
jgi:hypothetical protein